MYITSIYYIHTLFLRRKGRGGDVVHYFIVGDIGGSCHSIKDSKFTVDVEAGNTSKEVKI